MRVNTSGTLNTEMLKYVVKFESRLQNKRTLEYDQLFMRGTIDSCKVQEGVIGNFIVKLIVDRLDKYSNYKFECPQKTGFYHVTNFPIVENFDDLPPFVAALLGESRRSKHSGTIMAKFRGIPKPVLLAYAEAYASYVS